MVWAAEFVRIRGSGEPSLGECVIMAWSAVLALRRALKPGVGDEARAMLADMLSTGGDR
jgi:hypothetical protein